MRHFCRGLFLSLVKMLFSFVSGYGNVVNDFETQRNETTYTPIYISYSRSFPAFFFSEGTGQRTVSSLATPYYRP